MRLLLIALLVGCQVAPTLSRPEHRAPDAIPFKVQNDWALWSITCKPYGGSSHRCDLCYLGIRGESSHLQGWANVWCSRSRCEWILGNDDPRMAGMDPGDCERRLVEVFR